MNSVAIPIKTVEYEKPLLEHNEQGGSCVAHAWARTPTAWSCSSRRAWCSEVTGGIGVVYDLLGTHDPAEAAPQG